MRTRFGENKMFLIFSCVIVVAIYPSQNVIPIINKLSEENKNANGYFYQINQFQGHVSAANSTS